MSAPNGYANRDDEPTMRTRKLLERVDDAERMLARGKFWVSIFVAFGTAVAVAAFTIAIAWAQKADKADVTAHGNRLSTLEAQVADQRAEFEWFRRQLMEIARATRATIVPAQELPPYGPPEKPGGSQ